MLARPPDASILVLHVAQGALVRQSPEMARVRPAVGGLRRGKARFDGRQTILARPGVVPPTRQSRFGDGAPWAAARPWQGKPAVA